MPTYDYQTVKTALSVLTEGEKNRIVSLYLSSDTTAVNAMVDWDKATAAYGSASIGSMKVSLGNSLKKIAGKDGADPSPAKSKAGGGKKRKDGGDGDDEEQIPKKRGGGRKKKEASATPVKGDGEEDSAANGGIKNEVDEDFA
ncbi:hypothetical protein LTR56_023274 [Elasticomyces elasticus]|nr:hypothetical protein LTR56_023274 [Elasticomyces elasticus]KAK3624165.1 hypothetical protein LTR22_024070 [Elasticomyces elasticus]KAK4906371.1 hypothetical protein LTR49_024452 [Elasticomyces elasticus]KAK5744636.1 hypothetical protein LTS12_023411 [Elasticomyces elasticus]